MMNLKKDNIFPLRKWYENTGLSKSIDTCDTCRSIIDQGIEDDVAELWAIFNTNSEISKAKEAISYVNNGGAISDWAQKQWQFHYSETLPRTEYEEIIKKTDLKEHFVHIGCGALPFTGIFFSQYFNKVTLVDIDENACDLAKQLVKALDIKNIQVKYMNGKDLDMKPDDTMMVASMILDKQEIIKTASTKGVKDLLLRSTDDRPRGIFHKKDHNISDEYEYDFVTRTNPPSEIGNVTYQYKHAPKTKISR